MSAVYLMDISKWKSQLRKGLLEFGLLHLVDAKKRVYGLEIISALEQAGLPLTEGTLYPLLSRLHKESLLHAEWETPGSTGHPRKYYSLTTHGRLVLEAMDLEWHSISKTFRDFQGEQS